MDASLRDWVESAMRPSPGPLVAVNMASFVADHAVI